MGEVNAYTNLSLLCPNHHWEFDHGLIEFVPSIQVGPGGIQPPSPL